MPNHLIWYTGDRNPSITETVTVNGTAVDLTGLTCKFKMREIGSSTLTVDSAVSNTPSTDGVLRYDWASSDVDTAGRYLIWWEVTTSGKIQAVGEAIIEIRDHAPVTNTYVELEEVKSTLSISSTTYDLDLTMCIQSASRSIDAICNRRFWSDSGSTVVRYYTPSDWRRLQINDLQTMTSLVVDQDGDGTFEETWTENTDFVLEPMNAPTETPARPWETLVVRANSARTLPAGVERSVKLTGKFGWAAVPDEIQTAASLLAVRLFKRSREAHFGVAAFGGDQSTAIRIARTDPDVANLLAGYVRHTPFL